MKNPGESVAEDRLFSLTQFAERIGVSPRTAYTMWQRGDIRTVLVGRLRKVMASDVTKFIADLQPE